MEEEKKESFDIGYELTDWEDALIDSMSQKHNLDSEIVMDIAVTFMLNEASAVLLKRPCMLKSVRPLDILRMGPTTRSVMKTLKPEELFVVGSELRRAKGFPEICIKGEHQGEFMIEDEEGRYWYESEFLNDIQPLNFDDLPKVPHEDVAQAVENMSEESEEETNKMYDELEGKT